MGTLAAWTTTGSRCSRLLEDHHDTGLGQIDRRLAQLVHAGLLENLRGVALGTFGEFETAAASRTTLPDVLRD